MKGISKDESKLNMYFDLEEGRGRLEGGRGGFKFSSKI